MTSTAVPLTVLFDRDCGFCNWTVRQLRSLDRYGQLRYVPLQSAGTQTDRPELAEVCARHPLTDAVHVVSADGTVRSRGRAMLAILDVLPGGWLLRPWAKIPGVGSVADALYDRIAMRRGSLGRLVDADRGGSACVIDPDAATAL
ncbi:MAG: DUF393 domain-containing protein [Chloroflexi bacterium]|nr:DUF393 domain-containing protein [Chloroflexota bacterium]